MPVVFRNTDDFAKVAKSNAAVDRRRLADAAAGRRKAGQDGLDTGAAALEIMTMIPGMIAASSRAEIDRLTAIDPAHPRLAQVRASVDALAGLAPIARRLRARGSRALAVARTPVAGLHGFVEDASGEAVRGVVVTLKGGEGAAAPQATTAADGYFVLTPPKPPEGPPREGEGVQPLVVVIQDKAGRILHEDPIPFDPSLGIGYREYVIDRPGESRPEPRPRPGRRGRS